MEKVYITGIISSDDLQTVLKIFRFLNYEIVQKSFPDRGTFIKDYVTDRTFLTPYDIDRFYIERFKELSASDMLFIYSFSSLNGLPPASQNTRHNLFDFETEFARLCGIKIIDIESLKDLLVEEFAKNK